MQQKNGLQTTRWSGVYLRSKCHIEKIYHDYSDPVDSCEIKLGFQQTSCHSVSVTKEPYIAYTLYYLRHRQFSKCWMYVIKMNRFNPTKQWKNSLNTIETAFIDKLHLCENLSTLLALWKGNGFPSQKASNVESISISWRHHVFGLFEGPDHSRKGSQCHSKAHMRPTQSSLNDCLMII